MNDACNPNNAAGKLAGILDAGGIETSEASINMLDDNARKLYHKLRSEGSSDALTAGAENVSSKVDEVIESVTEADKSVKDHIRGGVMDIMKPADIMPDHVTGPVFEYLDKFFAENYNNMHSARSAYRSGINSVLDSVSPSIDTLDPAIRGQAAHWMRDLKDGYPFYGKSGTIWDKARNSAVSNVLDFSGTVLLGNPLEMIVKAPALYGIKPTLRGLIEYAKETKFNPLAKIPELEKAGVYGMDRGASKIPIIGSLLNAYNKAAETTMAFTDRPLKNLAYSIGKLDGGSGVEAVEKIAFKNRWGNDPRLGRSSKDAITLMNYTMNTYHMMGGMAKGLMTPGKRIEAARQLAMWTVITGGIGGQAALIPAPVAAILKNNDDYKAWEKANINIAGKLIRPGGITFGVGAELINRAFESWQRGVNKGTQKWESGDPQGALLDYADGGLSIMTILGRNPLGNSRIQKAARNTRDLFEGDLDGDYLQKNAEAFLPALKQAN